MVKHMKPGEIAYEPFAGSGPQVDRAEDLLKKWKVEPGQLWTIPSVATPGKEHRLLCGDSTKANDVARLLGGEKAAICFTSPPYNAGKRQHLSSRTKKGEKYTTGISDDRSQDEYLGLLVDFTETALGHAGYVLVNLQSLSGNKVALIDYLHRFRDHLADIAVWRKTNAPPAMEPRVMNSAFEFVFAFAAEEYPTRHVGTAEFRGTILNVIEGASACANEHSDYHAATFPLYLPKWAIESFTNASEVILDPFCGSGTTIVAAEQTGRLCRGIEIAPKYCAVILERLAGMGLEPGLQAGN